MNNEALTTKPVPLWRSVLVGRRPARTLVRVVVLVALSYFLFGFAFLPFRVTGGSMEPTYRDGSVNFANRLAYLRGRPQRGDVVAIRLAAGRHRMLLKRIVGLPGERIAIREGVVHINGQPLAEPYLQRAWPWNVRETVLAADEYYVIGDNRRMAQEEQEFGKFKADLIVGKVLF
jgi:signal peptidase I